MEFWETLSVTVTFISTQLALGMQTLLRQRDCFQEVSVDPRVCFIGSSFPISNIGAVTVKSDSL